MPMFRLIFLIAIGLVIPLFFLLLLVSSSYNKLRSLQKGCHKALGELAAAESALKNTQKKLPGAIGREPQLQDPAINALREELASMEKKRASAGQICNEAVVNYDAFRSAFPHNIVAGLFGFGPAERMESGKAKGWS